MRINRQLGELIDMVGGTCSLDRSFYIRRITSLSLAGPEDMAVVFPRGEASVFDDIDLGHIQRTRAGLVLAEKPLVAGKHFMVVGDALVAFQKIHAEISRCERVAGVHESAVVDASTTLEEDVSVGAGAVIDGETIIGAGTTIGARSYIGKRCELGAGVLIHPGVTILDGTIIGDGTIVNANTVIGSEGFGYQVTTTGLRKIPQIGSVTIGKDVEIGANVSIDRAGFELTTIGDGVKIDNNVHIAHGVTIGPSTAILAQTAIAGGATIGAGCQIGGQVGIKDHVNIGNGVKIVSKSAVLKDLADGAVVAGIPAVSFRDWKRTVACMARLPEFVREYRDRTRSRPGIISRLFARRM